jgi:hypothetical protein
MSDRFDSDGAYETAKAILNRQRFFGAFATDDLARYIVASMEQFIRERP